jgi:hypothetical protein
MNYYDDEEAAIEALEAGLGADAYEDDEEQIGTGHPLYEAALGQQLDSVLGFLLAQAEAEEQQAARAEHEWREAELRELAEQMPALRDEEQLGQVAQRAQALAEMAGDPDLATHPDVVRAAAETVAEANKPDPDSEKWAAIKSQPSEAFGSSLDKAPSREEAYGAALREEEAKRRNGERAPQFRQPSAEEQRAEWERRFDQLKGGPFAGAEQSTGEQVAVAIAPLTAKIGDLRGGSTPTRVPSVKTTDRPQS